MVHSRINHKDFNNNGHFHQSFLKCKMVSGYCFFFQTKKNLEHLSSVNNDDDSDDNDDNVVDDSDCIHCCSLFTKKTTHQKSLFGYFKCEVTTSPPLHKKKKTKKVFFFVSFHFFLLFTFLFLCWYTQIGEVFEMVNVSFLWTPIRRSNYKAVIR